MRERAATRLALALERERKRERDRVADLCLKGWLVTNTTTAFVQLTQLNQSLAFSPKLKNKRRERDEM